MQRPHRDPPSSRGQDGDVLHRPADVSRRSVDTSLATSRRPAAADRAMEGVGNHGNGMAQVVLVTGGAGFLGQHLVKLLQEYDDSVSEIRVFDIKPHVNTLGTLTAYIIYMTRFIDDDLH